MSFEKAQKYAQQEIKDSFKNYIENLELKLAMKEVKCAQSFNEYDKGYMDALRQEIENLKQIVKTGSFSSATLFTLGVD